MNNYFSNTELANMFESCFTDSQILMINEPTPSEYIEVKKDEEGNQYKSVKAYYVKQRLNLIFGFGWRFKIIRSEYQATAGECITHGRLTIPTSKGDIVREQFGKGTIEYSRKANKNVVSNLGNTFKSSASDALKKCASELGICWDIYNQDRPEKKKATSKMRQAVKKTTVQQLP